MLHLFPNYADAMLFSLQRRRNWSGHEMSHRFSVKMVSHSQLLIAFLVNTVNSLVWTPPPN